MLNYTINELLNYTINEPVKGCGTTIFQNSLKYLCIWLYNPFVF